MARIRHGEVVSLNRVEDTLDEIKALSASLRLASAPVRVTDFTPFDYMFPQLQNDPKALLPSDKPSVTVERLIALGASMSEKGDEPAFDSTIPSAYTYFGQFVDHDITLEAQSDVISNLDDPNLKPLMGDEVRVKIKNTRTPIPDLDSVYGVTSDGQPVPRSECFALLTIGGVSPSPKLGPAPPGKNNFNDLPRKPRQKDEPEIDREALIGDARNDENLIVSQMHVAFLRAHRTLVRGGLNFKEAKKTLVQHYQWLIIRDFLRRIADEEIVDDILTYGNRFYRPGKGRPDPPSCNLYMPLEFSAAAYRFGHSMVRSSYNYNVNFPAATLKQLFSLTAFSGELEDFDSLPEAWIIQWERFLDGGSNNARVIDTRLVEPLAMLQDTTGQPVPGAKGSLAVRNLLRGYLLRLPVGQKVAAALGLPVMTPDELLSVASGVCKAQEDALRDGEFLEHTPLWYYILAESFAKSGVGLGPVGSTIVAEVLIGLVRWCEDSILSQPGWKPTLGSMPGRFTLVDFFRLAGVWK